MKIEIFLDVACPWCFIGKRRLERALFVSGAQATLRFRAFQLQPRLPASGVPADSFFERKFGGRARMQAIFERVTQVGREDDIAFDFAKQRRAPNTELAHRVVCFAGSRGCAEQVVEALFRGYFERGVDLCDLSAIIAALAHVGIDLSSDELLESLAAGYGEEDVRGDMRLAGDYGVAGVPWFIFDQRYAVEGAQPVAHFQRLIEKLRVEDSPHARAASPG